MLKCSPHPTYKYASRTKNSSAVAAAEAGGAERFAAPTAVLFTKPNPVPGWAGRLRRALDKQNVAAEATRHAVVTAEGLRAAAVDAVMGVRDWKALSERGMARTWGRGDKYGDGPGAGRPTRGGLDPRGGRRPAAAAGRAAGRDPQPCRHPG